MGGLLGLGMGFSVISAVELIYFICIRCCFRKRNYLDPFTTEHQLKKIQIKPQYTIGKHITPG